MRRGSEGAWAAHKQKAEEVRDGGDGGGVRIRMFHQLSVVVLQRWVTPRSGQVELFKLYCWAPEVVNKTLTSVPSSGGLADFFLSSAEIFLHLSQKFNTTKFGVIETRI